VEFPLTTHALVYDPVFEEKAAKLSPSCITVGEEFDMGALALRSGFLWVAYCSTRFHKLPPFPKFEDHLDLFLERERSQRASVRFLLLDQL
jgi:hypothetical protein